jgi:hypothetical protein
MKKLIILSTVATLALISSQAFAKLGIEAENDTKTKIEVRIDNFTGPTKEWTVIEAGKSKFLDAKAGLRRVFWREEEKEDRKEKPLYSTWEAFLYPHKITIKTGNEIEKKGATIKGAKTEETKEYYLDRYDIVSGVPGIDKKTRSDQEAYILSDKPENFSATTLFAKYKTSDEYKKRVTKERAVAIKTLQGFSDAAMPYIKEILKITAEIGKIATPVVIDTVTSAIKQIEEKKKEESKNK